MGANNTIVASSGAQNKNSLLAKMDWKNCLVVNLMDPVGAMDSPTIIGKAT